MLCCRQAFEPFGSLKPLVGAVRENKPSSSVLEVRAGSDCCPSVPIWHEFCRAVSQLHCLLIRRAIVVFAATLRNVQFNEADVGEAAIVDPDYTPPVLSVSERFAAGMTAVGQSKT